MGSGESGQFPTRVKEALAMCGRGHVNFYRILREEDGLPVPHRGRKKKVKSGAPSSEERVKFPTPPGEEKVKSEPGNSLKLQENESHKGVNTKEREEKEAPVFSLFPEKAERLSPYWCEAHGFCHSERLPDHRPDCAQEWVILDTGIVETFREPCAQVGSIEASAADLR
jgi:hypothetical protein